MIHNSYFKLITSVGGGIALGVTTFVVGACVSTEATGPPEAAPVEATVTFSMPGID